LSIAEDAMQMEGMKVAWTLQRTGVGKGGIRVSEFPDIRISRIYFRIPSRPND